MRDRTVNFEGLQVTFECFNRFHTTSIAILVLMQEKALGSESYLWISIPR